MRQHRIAALEQPVRDRILIFAEDLIRNMPPTGSANDRQGQPFAYHGQGPLS